MEFRLIIALIQVVLIIFTIINLIKFYSRKSGNKKASREALYKLRKEQGGEFPSVPTDQVGHLKEIYKKDFNIAELVEISGIYSEMIFEAHHRGGKTESIVSYFNEHEVVVPNNSDFKSGVNYELKTALLKSKLYLISAEVSEIQENEELIQETNEIEGVSATDSLAKLDGIKQIRTQSTGEKKLFLASSIIIIIGTFFLSIMSGVEAFVAIPYVVAITLLCMLISLMLMLMKSKPVISFKGEVTKDEHGSVFIEKIPLLMPKKWSKTIENGEIVEIEAIKQVNKVVTLTPLKYKEFSVQKDNKGFKLSRFIYFIIMALYFSGFTYLVWNSKNFEKLRTYAKIKDIKSDFYTQKEINEHEFVEGQMIKIHNVRYLENPHYGEALVLNDFLPLDEKLNRKIAEWDAVAEDINIFVQNPAMYFYQGRGNKYTDNQYFTKLLELLQDANSSQNEIARTFTSFLNNRLNPINDEIEKLRLERYQNVESSLTLTGSSVNSSEYRYVRNAYDSFIKLPDLFKAFYGINDALVEGVVNRVEEKNGKLKLEISKYSSYDRIDRYKPYEKLFEFLYSVVAIFVMLMLLELFRLVFKRD